MEDPKLYDYHQQALRTQLNTLQSRITTHGNRIWQLPFTYLGAAAIAITLSADEKVAKDIAKFLAVALAIVGGFVLLAMRDAYLSYKRTAIAMNKVEFQLGLDCCTSARFAHALPHFLICSAAIVMMICSVFLIEDQASVAHCVKSV